MNYRITLMILIASIPLYSKNETSRKQPRMGIGIKIFNNLPPDESLETSLIPAELSNLYLPVFITHKFRLEPEIGIWRKKSKYTDSEVSLTSYRIGTGFHMMIHKGNMLLFYGIQGGCILSFNNVKLAEISDKFTEIDYYTGPILGGEYFLSKYFSLGLEAQFNYINLGTPEGDDENTYIITNNALIFFKIYFI